VEGPNLLIELCREVIDRICVKSDDQKTGQEEAQLREIARAIDKLGKLGVPVPEALRAEKTRLAGDLAEQARPRQLLDQLSDELESFVGELKKRLGRDAMKPNRKVTRRKRSRSPKTNREILRQSIIKALTKVGGRARAREVLQDVEEQLSGKLLPGDFEICQDGRSLYWKKNTQWERLRMINDGILRSDSPRGFWELTENL
jgi:hypothetical protein